MSMFLSMLFDDDDETAITAMWSVGPHVLQIRQRPQEGRVYNAEKEAAQEYAMSHPDEAYQPSSALHGEYDSAFPNVGLVVWQSGFVLAEFLLRTQPPARWAAPARVLDLGCGVGQLGLPLAMSGADVTLTDLEHIVPLTAENVALNRGSTPVPPTVKPYMWGTDLTAAGLAGPWDYVVAADVLYEPQHYDELLDSLEALLLGSQRRLPPPRPHSVGNPGRGNTTTDTDAAACQADAEPGAAAALTTPPSPLASQRSQAAAGATGAEALDLEPAMAECPTAVAVASPSGATECATATASAPWEQTRCFICYRVRRYGEHGFEAKASARGFSVAAVPVDQLHADFQCGGYRLIQLRAASKGV